MPDPITLILAGILISLASGLLGKIWGERGSVSEKRFLDSAAGVAILAAERTDNLLRTIENIADRLDRLEEKVDRIIETKQPE